MLFANTGDGFVPLQTTHTPRTGVIDQPMMAPRTRQQPPRNHIPTRQGSPYRPKNPMTAALHSAKLRGRHGPQPGPMPERPGSTLPPVNASPYSPAEPIILGGGAGVELAAETDTPWYKDWRIWAAAAGAGIIVVGGAILLTR